MDKTTIFEVGKAYSFSVYPSTIITNDFDYAVCDGVFTADIASTQSDIRAMHAQVFPYLPAGTPDDAHMYHYARFLLTDGSTRILGIPWINIDTVKISKIQKILVEIRGQTADKINEIRTVLLENGFTDISMTVITDTSAFIKTRDD